MIRIKKTRSQIFIVMGYFRLFVVFFLLSSFCAYSANEDTPNLSFEDGDFGGWSLYYGDYYETDDGQYVYDWAPVAAGGERIKVMNTVKGTMDPTIACPEQDFQINPDGVPVARIGRPCYTEGLPTNVSGLTDRCKLLDAAAERMTYTFVVTEKTALLTYKFALVLADPTSENEKAAHTGEQLPQFSFKISSVGEDGSEKSLSCSEYSVKVGSGDLEANGNCRLSSTRSGNSPSDYKYKKWTTGAIDLTNQVGNTVTIDVWTHDCLVENKCSGVATRMAGGHDAWGYFWAETRELELKTKNCVGENPTLEAPEGFYSYKWSRSDGVEGTIKTPDPEKPWLVEVDRATVTDGVTYTCEVVSEFCGSTIKIEAELDKVTVTPDFVFEDTCGGAIKYENKSIVEGDEVYSYSWDFGDSTYSVLKDPKHEYPEPGNYTAKLIVRSAKGCVDSVKQDVIVRYFPNLEIDGNTKYCKGDTIDLEVLEAETGSEFLWSTGDKTHKIRTLATESKYYDVKVTDRFSCEYEKNIYVSVYEKPTVRLRGSFNVCYGDTALLIASGAISYSWNVGVADDSLKVRPLEDTRYTVVGTANNGCKAVVDTVVKVLDLPVVTIEGDDEVCENHSVTLTAKGAVTYIWSDLFAGAERSLSPETSGQLTFSVTGTDANKCSATATKSLYVKPTPDVAMRGDSIVCVGEIARQEAVGADTYEWHNETTLNYLAKVLDKPEVWTVTGTTDGCSVTVSRMMNIKKPSNVWIDGVSEICEGDTLRWVAAGAKSYKWSTGAETDSLVLRPAVSTVFQVVATSENGCTVTKSKEVVVNRNPVIEIKGDASVCANSYASLEAVSVSGDASVFYWSIGAISPKVESLISDETTFTVRGENLKGCVGTAVHTVSLIAKPKITFAGDTAICKGKTAMIVARGASSYVWHDGSKGSQFVKNMVDSEVFTVTGTLNGCSADTSIRITVLEPPTIWTEGVAEICAGEALEIEAKGANSYKWSNGTQNPILTASPTTSTTYKLTGEDIFGCVSVIDVPVVVHSKPYVAIDPDSDAEVCRGEKALIKVSGKDIVSFIWSNGEEGEQINPRIDEPSTFEVEATDKFGCKNKASHIVLPVMPPVLSFLGDTLVCVGDFVSLAGQGATTYRWFVSGDTIDGGSYSTLAEGNQMLTLEGTTANCTSIRLVQVKVKTPPNILVSGDKQVCPEQTFTITASGAVSYKWNTGEVSETISYAPNATTTYYVTGVDEAGCSNTTSYTIEVLPLPEISISMENYAGCPNTLDTVLLSASGGVYYTWSSEPQLAEFDEHPHAETISALVEEETVVALFGRDIHGCENSANVKIKKLPRQEIAFEVEPRIIEPDNPHVHFKGNTPLNSTWYWTPVLGENEVVEGRSVKHKYGTTQIGDSVTVLVRSVDPNGCEYHGEAVVYVWKDVWAPTAFTANNDEKNETFRFYGGKYIEEFSFIIYNRLGQIVFRGNSIDDEWDGTYEGMPCPIGVYGWVVQYKSDYKGIKKEGEKKGFVSILK